MQCSFVHQLFAKFWMNSKWLNVDIKLVVCSTSDLVRIHRGTQLNETYNNRSV